MNQTLKNPPIAFITGASSGFGLLTTIALAKEGYIVIASMRNLDKRIALENAAELACVSQRIEIIELDVTHTNVEEVINDIIGRYGRIDLLINNAGYAAGGFTEELPVEEWKKQFDVNFFGIVRITRVVLPHMRQQRSGKIVNISSISGRIGLPSMGPYVSSKYALEGFSESLRLEMLRYNVYVVLIEPGSYKTAIWQKGLESVPVHPNSPYKVEMEKILKHVNQVSATAPVPEEVIKQIVKIAKARYPKLRYPIGKGIKLGIFLKQLVPWKRWERIILKRL
jgi:NAD(P)-dependent dehydrogenase (short-subunit alcohol dehydrogenase family)